MTIVILVDDDELWPPDFLFLKNFTSHLALLVDAINKPQSHRGTMFVDSAALSLNGNSPDYRQLIKRNASLEASSFNVKFLFNGHGENNTCSSSSSS